MKPFKDSKEELAFLSYVLGAEEITFPKSGMATNDIIMSAFGYDSPFGDLENHVISDAYQNDILVVVEKHPDIPIRVGPRETYLTLNPYHDVPAKILEIESGRGMLEVPPKERIAALRGLIEEAIKDTKPLTMAINDIRQNAKSLHSELYAKRNHDVRVQELIKSGGFDIVARGVDGLTKEIEAIVGAQREIKKAGNYSNTKLNEVAEFLGTHILEFSERPFHEISLEPETVDEYRRSWRKNVR